MPSKEPQTSLQVALTLPVEYAEQGNTSDILFNLACFMNTVALNVYVFLSSTVSTWRNALFVLLWLCHRNT